MKVAVSLTFEIDPESWNLAYGTGVAPAEIRRDVREYVLNAARSLAPFDEGGMTAVTVKT